ncbi:MAG: hypothetical protein JWQ20_359, partial [Conexibacter sp.]|nr:hypothetical protein [Conexibacter sp.]
MHARTCAAVGAVVVLLSVVGASSAQAAPAFHCEASALRATLAGAQTIEPVTHGRSGDCATGAATPSVALPMLLDAQALIANSTFDAVSPSGSATGGIAHLRVLPTPELIAQVQAPIFAFIDTLPLRPVTLPVPIPLVGNLVQLDVRAALKALVPTPGTALLSVDLLKAQANVGCQPGGAVFSGSSQVAGVKLLGQDVGADSVLSQVLPLINGQSISLSQLDLSKVTFYGPLGPITGPLLTTVQAAVAPLLAAIPPIQLPASLADVRLTPNQQLRGDNSLTQRALHASISLAGQPVLDAVLGEANVSAAEGMCAPPAAPPAPAPAAAAAPVR